MKKPLQLLFLMLFCFITANHRMEAQCDRLLMVQEYEEGFLNTQVNRSELDWSGATDNCLAGQVSDMAKQRMIDRINYYRKLSHVSSRIALDTSLTDMCQAAALMMHSNNALSHDPPETWECWTEDGRKAASKSNLALGAFGTSAIALYMEDPGTNNWAVGHRRWILFSRAKSIGLGSTSRAHAMYVIHDRQDAPADLDYITFPSEGYFPLPLVPARWSFSKPRANFSIASVTMLNPNDEPIQVELQEIRNGFGDNTIVWEPESGTIDRFTEVDLTYTITIKDVILQGDTLDYQYQVTLSPPVYPPQCQNEGSWNEAACTCEQAQTTALKEGKTPHLNISPNPADQVMWIKYQREDDRSISQEASIEIWDAMGRMVRREDWISSNQLIETATLPAGFYVVKAKNQDQITSRKIVIRH